MKKIIVFGASGETGRYFVDYACEHGVNKEYELIAVGQRQTSFFKNVYGVDYVSLDITDMQEFSGLPQEEVHAVIDLAGYMPARMDADSPRKMIDVNLIGTLNILEYCVKTGTDRILFAQSFGDIKDHAEKDPLLTVDLPRNFSFNSDHTVYLIAKNAAVDMIEYFHQHYGLKRFIFRLPTIYSYGRDRVFYKDGIACPLWYRILIDRAMNGDDMEVWGDPSRVKDMVYVKDFAQMLYLATFVDREEGYYNVGTGVGTSLLDQLTIMTDLYAHDGVHSRLIMCPDKPNTPQYVMDISPAVNELGYSPKYFYEDYLIDYRKEMQAGRFDSL